MTVTLRSLEAEYGKQWTTTDAAGGGWCAVRRTNLAPQKVARGLSNVRCGGDLEELARHLAEEKRGEEKDSARLRLRPVS
ncbi:hypothetical protein [Microtetraspora sp. NBRC 16547]|uniref:hypothetical protein n=1 Tax=Microtetraspora sp. NBRC 16547 TaxID=3030993 RepID=UPI0024A19AF3|nr:hypothetical protein [Microtetraspora sp. NBRC 16547]GLW99461.1 hypothetical protein Misp02_35480 [Microtetraspora sp. NBRC 16547]